MNLSERLTLHLHMADHAGVIEQGAPLQLLGRQRVGGRKRLRRRNLNACGENEPTRPCTSSGVSCVVFRTCFAACYAAARTNKKGVSAMTLTAWKSLPDTAPLSFVPTLALRPRRTRITRNIPRPLAARHEGRHEGDLHRRVESLPGRRIPHRVTAPGIGPLHQRQRPAYCAVDFFGDRRRISLEVGFLASGYRGAPVAAGHEARRRVMTPT